MGKKLYELNIIIVDTEGLEDWTCEKLNEKKKPVSVVHVLSKWKNSRSKNGKPPKKSKKNVDFRFTNLIDDLNRITQKEGSWQIDFKQEFLATTVKIPSHLGSIPGLIGKTLR